MEVNISVKKLIFAFSYILFTFSLFNSDVANVFVFEKVANISKYLSLLLLFVGILYESISEKKIKRLSIVLIFLLLVILKSGVLYFIFFILLSVMSMNISDKDIIKTALLTVSFYGFLTFFLFCIGVHPDIVTHRYVNTSDRHSFGFYHSNVLPLIYMYCLAYYCIIMRRKMKIVMMLGLILADGIIFLFCNSKNSLVFSLIIILCKYICDRKMINTFFKKCIIHISKIYVFIIGSISVIVPYLLGKSKIFDIIDFAMSYRFSSAKKKYDIVGISIFPTMDNASYFADGIVIDNGYSYVASRFGLLVLGVLVIIAYFISKKYQNNVFVLIVLIVISTANAVDNDIFDYSCLPFIVIGIKAFAENIIKKREKKYG